MLTELKNRYNVFLSTLFLFLTRTHREVDKIWSNSHMSVLLQIVAVRGGVGSNQQIATNYKIIIYFMEGHVILSLIKMRTMWCVFF